MNNDAISEKFRRLSVEKMEKARELSNKLKAEREEELKNSAFKKIQSFLSGDINNDSNFTQEELTLLANTDDYNLLTLDENGRLIKISQEKEEIALKATDAPSEPDKTDDGHIENISVNSDENDSISAESAEEEDLELEIDASDAEILRIEDLDCTEANIYISTASNLKSNEHAYAAVVEQGYGRSKRVSVISERLSNTSSSNMAYRAASSALSRFIVPGQIINKITIFIEYDLGIELQENSWSLSSGAYNPDASLYSQIFKACFGQKITVFIAPAQGKCQNQEIATDVANHIVKTPA